MMKHHLDQKQFDELSDERKLVVLRMEENFIRLDAHRPLNWPALRYLQSQQLLTLAQKFFSSAHLKGFPVVLRCPEFRNLVAEQYRNRFTVAGGKPEFDEVNWKFIASFETLSEAIHKGIPGAAGLPIVEITYNDTAGRRWALEIKERTE
jgi:hypothetical protein